MYSCKCGKEFEKYTSLISHGGRCHLYERKPKKVSFYFIEGKYVCECKREFDNHQSLNAHFTWCSIHRKGKEIVNKRGGEKCGGWNKGLTKYNNSSLMKMSKSLSNREHVKGQKHTNETKRKLSIQRTKYLEINPHIKYFEVSNGKRTIKVQGEWEFRVAKWLNDNKIIWDRKSIKYGNRNYTPDFILDKNILIEVKGWMRDRDIAKMHAFLNYNPNFKILLIEGKEMKKLSQLTLYNLINFQEKYKVESIDYVLYKRYLN